jgi:hypothetical protein
MSATQFTPADTTIEFNDKKITKALVRAFAVRGAAGEELFKGERADLARELHVVRARLGERADLAQLIELALQMDALPAMRGAMQVWEGRPRA